MCTGPFLRLAALSTCLLALLGNVQVKATTVSPNLTATPVEDHVIVLLANNDRIKKVDMATNESTLLLANRASVTGVDYIYDADLMFWTDEIQDQRLIQSVNLTAGYPIKVVIYTDISEPDGIAVDWIYGHIYWTDSGIDTIGVCDLQGTIRKTLFDTGLTEPKPIAVDPTSGWMFWADSGSSPKIERAGMDGCCREAIISTDITWPDALAIDCVAKKVFWIDGKVGTLSTAKYDGSERRVIIANPSVVHHSFGIDVFEDSVYWSDFKSRAIHSAHKVTGQNVTTVKIGISLPLGLRVYHPLKQPSGQNYCKDQTQFCSHFCFPTPRITPTSPNITCSCPNGKSLAEDGLNCIDEVTEAALTD